MRAAIVGVLVTTATAHAQTTAPATRPAWKGKSAAQLVGLFARADTSPDDRIAIGRAVAGKGAGAVARLIPAVKIRLRIDEAVYRREFQRAATAARVARAKTMATKYHTTPAGMHTKMREWRKAILDLQRQEGGSEAAIRRQAAPAMENLAELLWVRRGAVLAGSEALRSRRAHLLALEDLLVACDPSAEKPIPVPDPLDKERASKSDSSQATRGRRRYSMAGKVAMDRALPPAFRPPTGPKRMGLDMRLWQAEHLATILAIPMNANSHRILRRNEQLAARIRSEEAAAILDANRLRLLAGLWALQTDVRLCDCARDHSQDMIKYHFIGHVSPVPGKRQPWDRAKRFGTRCGGENITVGATNPCKANYNWFHSPHHFFNLFHQFKRIGVGHVNTYWTQNLGW